ncbi:MAG TPA: ElyC/SanA/YdcF family protein [Blastocatellia bacterium]|nr:ElyC/SanA/YdcF family protein [Blastocatellia bacterium]HMZ18373.1 ElyC/SanA/YdcF family protein [Blastocatellia bacterium]HNG30068.1 ElyC/SanA/YdcF family protein [Blastocatellia bacterium]
MMKRGRLFLLLLLIAIGLAFVYVHFQIHNYDDRIITNLNELDTSRWQRPRVAIVFGASVYGNGDLSPILEDRVDTAIELYRARKVDRILVSGDNRHASYNEPKAMQDYLITHAVAAKDVIVDYGGRSTYETCLRAKDIFGLERAVLVSQGYHLPRALYIANQLGLDAVGMAGDLRLRNNKIDYQSLRELAAEMKAYLNLRYFPPETLLGERVPIQ